MWRARPDQVMWERSETEIVCLDLQKSEYFTLNETASALWVALVDGAEEPDLVKCLSAGFEAPQDEAERDVAEFLEEMQRRGLIESV